MSIRDYLATLRRRWVLVAVCVVLAAVAAVAYSATSQPLYRAQTTSFVTMGATDGSGSLLQGSQFTLQRITSYTDVIDSPDVLQPVIDALGLDTSVGELRSSVDAVSPADTVLIDISATSDDPAEAAAVADAVTLRFAAVIEQLETPRDGGASPVKVTVTVPAVEPSAPVSPRPVLNLVLGLALGAGLGAGLALLREQLDTSVRTADDVVAITSAGPLGMVRADPHSSRRPLVVLDPTDVGAEAYRTIRTNLQFVDVDHPPRRIVVTSAVQGEGKSTTAGNLAVTLAQGGLQVCLVDADMRRPRVAEVFGLEGAVGLSNVLAGQYDVQDVLIRWRDGLLTVLPAGTSPPNPSELLGSQHMSLLLDKLSSSFDVLVIDSPPLLPVSDAVILAQATDGALLVVRHGSTSHEQVTAAVASLAAVGAPLIGTVMTRVPKGRGRAAQAYRYAPTRARTSLRLPRRRSTPTPPTPAARGRLQAPWTSSSGASFSAYEGGGSYQSAAATQPEHVGGLEATEVQPLEDYSAQKHLAQAGEASWWDRTDAPGRGGDGERS